MIKTIKLFGIKILEIETLSVEEKKEKEILKETKPKGEILDIMPEEYEKAKIKEIMEKYGRVTYD